MYRTTRQKQEETFWKSVDTSGGPDACWPWRKAKMPNGYGKLGRSGRQWLAHRYAWTLANGPIPDGMCALHKCDNRICCNPAHHFLGTYADNHADMDRKGRRAVGSRSGAAKLHEDAVRRIRRYHAMGVTQKALANLFGIGRGPLCMIVNRKAWKHVTEEAV